MEILVLNHAGQGGESRVATTPDAVKILRDKFSLTVSVVKGAGAMAGFADDDYKKMGAKIVNGMTDSADIVIGVIPPNASDINKMKKGAWLLAPLNARTDKKLLSAIAKKNISAFALELIPRISRAQNMDVLSSQANLAGYRAVLLALQYYQKATPMMMTAAGTLKPAKFLIMGIGVAGLQAIATAKRLGGIVMATDVRPATKEQVESLGGTFVAVMDKEFKQAQTASGYAKPMSKSYQAKQQALIKRTLPDIDIVITTALIPGRTAPQLLTNDMVAQLKSGAVVVDMAVESGGNVAGSSPDKVVHKNGVTIVPAVNLARLLPDSASSLFARNIVNFLGNMWSADDKKLSLKLDDEIIKGSLVAHNGKVLLS